MSDTTVSFPELDKLNDKIAAKQRDLAVIFEEAGPELDLTKVKSVSGDTMAKAAHIREANNELTDLGKQRDELKAVQRAAESIRTAGSQSDAAEEGSEPGASGAGGSGGAKQQTFADAFIDSVAFKGKKGPIGPEARLDIELKALLTSGTGWVPESIRSGRIEDLPTRPLQVADIIPQTTTSQSSVTYMEETTFTNAAAEVDEGGTYAEATLALTERTSAVRKIGVWLPVTDEQLEDVPQVRGYINNRLPFMVRQRLDSQLLVGSGAGTPTQIRGLLNVVGIQTQAKGADPTPDAVYKAMTKVRTIGFAEQSAAVFHPNDWQDVRLLRTTDGIYIWGNPSDAGPERIWGLRVVLAIALTENTGVVGDFDTFSELAVRRGIDVQVSNSHSTFFTEGKQAIRADIRAAFVVYRPTAFCTVTGI
jgi:HK97 family phage major capsid protein